MHRPLLAIAVVLACGHTAFAQSEAREAPPEWLASAEALVPGGYVAGQLLRHDAGDKTGMIAVFPVSADDPKTPGTAFERGKVFRVRLDNVGNKLQAVSGEVIERPADLEESADEDRTELYRDMQSVRRPPGTMPCDLNARSIDTDKAGLNVRAEPSAKARILGTLPPPLQIKGGAGPASGWQTEFRVIGYKDGWFLIEGAQPPGLAYEDASSYPRNAPKPYAGRGWVHASRIGADFANGGRHSGGLFQAPHIESRWRPAKAPDGSPISADSGPKRILACSADWALVESHDNVRGWWRRLCANQATTCS